MATTKKAPAKAAAKEELDALGRRDATDPLEGSFVEIKSGEHEGRVGAFLRTVERDVKGFPKRILVRSRDEHNELLDVAYDDAKATDYNGGR